MNEPAGREVTADPSSRRWGELFEPKQSCRDPRASSPSLSVEQRSGITTQRLVDLGSLILHGGGRRASSADLAPCRSVLARPLGVSCAVTGILCASALPRFDATQRAILRILGDQWRGP